MPAHTSFIFGFCGLSRIALGTLLPASVTPSWRINRFSCAGDVIGLSDKPICVLARPSSKYSIPRPPGSRCISIPQTWTGRILSRLATEAQVDSRYPHSHCHSYNTPYPPLKTEPINCYITSPYGQTRPPAPSRLASIGYDLQSFAIVHINEATSPQLPIGDIVSRH